MPSDLVCCGQGSVERKAVAANMKRVLSFVVLLFLVCVISGKQSGGKQQKNPWIIHKRLSSPKSMINCQIPWKCLKSVSLKRNCTARLNCIYQNYKCSERNSIMVVTPTPTNNTTAGNASNQITLMTKCKERVKKCLTKEIQCKKKMSCLLFRIYQCERLQDKSAKRPAKRVPKKTWATKIRKKIQRKKKRINRLKNKRRNKRRKGKRNRKRGQKRKRKRGGKRKRKP